MGKERRGGRAIQSGSTKCQRTLRHCRFLFLFSYCLTVFQPFYYYLTLLLLFKLAVHGQNTGSRDQTHCGQGTLGLLATAWVAIQVVTLHLSPNKNAFDVLMPYSHSQFSILSPIQHQTDNRNRIRIRIQQKKK